MNGSNEVIDSSLSCPSDTRTAETVFPKSQEFSCLLLWSFWEAVSPRWFYFEWLQLLCYFPLFRVQLGATELLLLPKACWTKRSYRQCLSLARKNWLEHCSTELTARTCMVWAKIRNAIGESVPAADVATLRTLGRTRVPLQTNSWGSSLAKLQPEGSHDALRLTMFAKKRELLQGKSMRPHFQLTCSPSIWVKFWI